MTPATGWPHGERRCDCGDEAVMDVEVPHRPDRPSFVGCRRCGLPFILNSGGDMFLFLFKYEEDYALLEQGKRNAYPGGLN